MYWGLCVQGERRAGLPLCPRVRLRRAMSLRWLRLLQPREVSLERVTAHLESRRAVAPAPAQSGLREGSPARRGYFTDVAALFRSNTTEAVGWRTVRS